MIGMFDSGVGGLTVLCELKKLAPRADVIYFGDTINAPYANKSHEELEILTLKAFRFLKEHGACDLLSACNSVSASVIRPMFELFGINQSRVIEMIEPTVSYIRANDFGKLVVIATPATIKSNLYQNELRNSIPVACKHLSGLIEKGEAKPVLLEEIRLIVADIVEYCPDAVLLGCTHYPLVLDLLESEMKKYLPEIVVIDPSRAVAQAAILEFGESGNGSLVFYVSHESDVFNRLAREMFGDVPQIITVNLLQKK